MFTKSSFILSPRKANRLRVAALFVASVSGLTVVMCLAQSGAPSEPNLNYLAGSLTNDEPQAVYADNPNDSWNRIFHCLFTRTIQTRLSNDFTSAAPFNPVEAMGLPHLAASTRLFQRIESGDRAIDPLYPSYVSMGGASGAFQVLDEPRFSQLEGALTDALRQQSKRSAVSRALMQSDIWAAYESVARNFSIKDEEGRQRQQRKNHLMPLLLRFLKKLALTSQEIDALPDNYAAAAKKHRLPDLFAKNSEWLEIQWVPERQHDMSSAYRRAARVFVKPSSPPQDVSLFLKALRPERLNENKLLEAVALVTQNLLINSDGKVVPTRLTYEMQMRRFAKGQAGAVVQEATGKAQIAAFELSRRLLLTKPKEGGLSASDDHEPAYLPMAGNDYTFATVHGDANHGGAPILVPLRSRCASCHGAEMQVVMTLSIHGIEAPRPIRHLNSRDNEHSRYVAARKMEREDFKALQQQWLSAVP